MPRRNPPVGRGRAVRGTARPDAKLLTCLATGIGPRVPEERSAATDETKPSEAISRRPEAGGTPPTGEGEREGRRDPAGAPRYLILLCPLVDEKSSRICRNS